jgi:hypothetical protein
MTRSGSSLAAKAKDQHPQLLTEAAVDGNVQPMAERDAPLANLRRGGT